MKRKLINTAKKVLNTYPNAITKKEYEDQKFSKFNERPIEYGFVFNVIGKLYPKEVLDVGTGNTALPHLIRNCGCLVTAVDNIVDYWSSGMVNRHYHVVNDDITDTKVKKKFDLITCISTLEHIVKSDTAIDNMFSLLKPGGHLIITCPYTEHQYVEDVYKLPDTTYLKPKPYGAQSFSRKEITGWCERNNAEIVEQQYWKFWDGEFWTVGNSVIPPERTDANSKHQISCMLFKKK